MVQDREDRLCNSIYSVTLLAVALSLVITARCSSAADVKASQLQAAAEKGYVPQEIELAAAYFAGRGVPQDDKMAAYWYRKAAESGDPDSENEIGYFYEAGIGVSRDPARAFHWYQLAASSGLAVAKVNLGVLYVWGIGVEKNPELAAKLFREAASKGNGTAAAYQIGRAHV